MMKHAYLIMAHANFEQLSLLLKCLDYPQNDIFIHIDKKAEFDSEKLTTDIRFSNVYFTRQCCVNWGGYSQIEAELILLEEATQRGEYARYHLLTGVDFPLYSQRIIHNFFNAYENVEFISGGYVPKLNNMWFLDRIRYFYPFQDVFQRKNLLGKIVRKGLVILQKIIRVDRLRGSDLKYNVGSAYFDITDRFARYVVEQKQQIKQHFMHTFCADEIFLQWVYLHWENPNERYVSNRKDHSYIEETYFDVCRAIDWSRGNPYTYKDDDYDMLMESGCLFARKFDYKTSPELINRIIEKVKAF